MEAHLQVICSQFRVPTVVAINRFATDSPAELQLVRESAIRFGAADACVISNHADGGEGAITLAEAIERICFDVKPSSADARFLYSLDCSIKVSRFGIRP